MDMPYYIIVLIGLDAQSYFLGERWRSLTNLAYGVVGSNDQYVMATEGKQKGLFCREILSNLVR